MNNNETNRTNDSSDPNSRAVTLRAAGNGRWRAGKVLFIAASAFGVAAMPGVADQLLSSLGAALISTAQAAPDQCQMEILPGYEEGVIKFLMEQGIKPPDGLESHISLFELSEDYNATIVRDRGISILVTGKSKVLPMPPGLYVFPDGFITEILEGGRLGKIWGKEFESVGQYWAMCRTPEGGWVNCT